MNPPGTSQSQRSIQRRSPAADPGPPPSVPARTLSPGFGGGLPAGPQSRLSSSVSSKTAQRPGSSRSQNGGQMPPASGAPPPLSQIEKSVTHLLVATKQLLETLTQWSRLQATDTQVSDVYVRLGYEFNIACRAFTAINVDTSDLGNVPELLRGILESTLSQEASVESLEKYLPRIRDIIISLLHGLKRKQQRLRQRPPRDGENLPRNSSVSSVGSGNTGLTTLLDQGINHNFRSDGGRGNGPSDNAAPRLSSVSTPRERLPRDASRGSSLSDQSTLSSTTMQNIPVLPVFPGDETNVPQPPVDRSFLNIENYPIPQPPRKTQDALAALQRGGELERRASRRYSAYQISKHLGASPNGLPMPPVQNTPIPNRGRTDARESMRAVQTRGDQRPVRQKTSRLTGEDSPVRVPSDVLEEPDSTPQPPEHRSVPFVDPDGSGATLKSPPTLDTLPPFALPSTDGEAQSPKIARPDTPQNKEASVNGYSPDQPPTPGKELTIFLQYKTKVKKFVLADGYNDLSMASLQLAFIEKFAWSTHNNGVELPEIYIQDPISGVRHELEDVRDIKDRSVLVLNIEVLDEVKRHIDEGLGGIKRIVEGVKLAVDDQQATIQGLSDRQQDAAKEMARMASAPSTSSNISYTAAQRTNGNISPTKGGSQAQISEIQSLRRDLAVLRQTYSSFQADIQSSMSQIRSKATTVKVAAAQAAIPDIKGESGRSYVNMGKKTIVEDSDKLVAQVDDLQDIVEDLRKDVVTRGVRPLPRQLETVAKDIAQATNELKKMQDFLNREKPIWTKIWQKELEVVCQDREELNLQEDLAADLQDDLEKATQTFALVEEATKEQLKDVPGGAGAPRVLSRGLLNITAADPSVAKEGVLGEVRALQPNHENRLEAIERAERLRKKDLEERKGGELLKELSSFVDEGKLKKSGGFEEVERARVAKDDKIRKEVWERQNGMTQADATNDEVDDADEVGEEAAEADEVMEVAELDDEPKDIE